MQGNFLYLFNKPAVQFLISSAYWIFNFSVVIQGLYNIPYYERFFEFEAPVR